MGGGCAKASDTGDNYDPDPTGLVYADVKMGESFMHPGYCEWSQYGEGVNCGSKEWAYGGNSAVKCKCRSACDNCCCWRKNCKRIAYLGDPMQCCAGLVKTLGKGKTCAPSYRSYDTPDCNQYMAKYCSIGNNFFTNPNCRVWTEKQREAASETFVNVCSRPENINHQYCGCIKAALEVRDKYGANNKIAVECVDNRCVNSPLAIKTFQMHTNPCNVVNCDMDINGLKLIMQEGSKGNFNVDFIQKCDSQYNQAVKEQKTTTTKTTTNTTTKDDDKTGYYILGGLLFLALVSGGGYFIWKRYNDDDDNDDDE